MGLVVIEIPNPILSSVTRSVDPTSREVGVLIDEMVELMGELPGCVGIAANQVGVGISVFVVDVSGHKRAESSHGLLALINPKIIESSGREMMREGCLSVPHFTVDVPRAKEIEIEGFNRSGAALKIRAHGYEARALQHEIDHLWGRTILDRALTPNAVHKRVKYLS